MYMRVHACVCIWSSSCSTAPAGNSRKQQRPAAEAAAELGGFASASPIRTAAGWVVHTRTSLVARPYFVSARRLLWEQAAQAGATSTATQIFPALIKAGQGGTPACQDLEGHLDISCRDQSRAERGAHPPGP